MCKYSEKYDDVITNTICEQPLWPSSSSAPPLWWNHKREQIAKLLEFWIHKICNLQEINISAGMKKCSAISGQILQQLELKESFPISRDDQLKNTTIRLLYPAESSNFNIFNFQFPEMINSKTPQSAEISTFSISIFNFPRWSTKKHHHPSSLARSTTDSQTICSVASSRLNKHL